MRKLNECYNPKKMHPHKLPIIQATRVCLRAVTERDLDSLYEIFSDPEVMLYWSTTPLPNKEAARELLHEIQSGYKDDFLKWGIARKTDDKMIGTCTLYNLDLTHKRGEIGYALGRSYWRQGYVHEALQALLRFAFEELNLHRIEADVDPRNAPSIKTLERLGFQREGYLRERWQVGGDIQDAVFYGLLRHEWITDIK
jgi:RimJ/RimL family protein N-acetyltransferase